MKIIFARHVPVFNQSNIGSLIDRSLMVGHSLIQINTQKHTHAHTERNREGERPLTLVAVAQAQWMKRV